MINMFMNEFLYELKLLDDDYYRSMIQQEYLSKDSKNSITSSYNYYLNDSGQLANLEKQIDEIYNLPKVEYFLIFNHKREQSIHVDGIRNIRYCSLNLTISYPDNAIMNFYKPKDNTDFMLSDARYYKNSNIEKIKEYILPKSWYIVNSGIPHNVSGFSKENPRITLCLRFYGNPSFEELVNRINGK